MMPYGLSVVSFDPLLTYAKILLRVEFVPRPRDGGAGVVVAVVARRVRRRRLPRLGEAGEKRNARVRYARVHARVVARQRLPHQGEAHEVGERFARDAAQTL